MTSTQIPQPDVAAALPVRLQLYSPNQMVAATLLGSFAAAGWCARTNLIALGKGTRGNVAFVTGLALTAGLLALAIVLPENVPGPVLVAPQLIAVLLGARAEFGALLGAHDKKSAGRVIAVGVISLLAIVVVLLAVAFVAPA